MSIGDIKFLLILVFYVLVLVLCNVLLAGASYCIKYTDSDFLGKFLLILSLFVVAIAVIIPEFYLDVAAVTVHEFFNEVLLM